MASNLKQIRKLSFNKYYQPDLKLKEYIGDIESHSFLLNPPIANIYQYLVNYVLECSSVNLNIPKVNLKILDWGAGKGHVSYFFRKFGAENLVTCDIVSDKNDSTFGQDTPIIKAAGINVEPLNHEYLLPYDDNTFDVVVSFGVLEHVPKEEESIIEIHRILKTGGMFFCFHLPTTSGYVHKLAHLRKDFYHDRLYNKERVVKLNKISGLQVEDLWYRSLLPKNSINYRFNHFAEIIDQWLVNHTLLKYLSTNIEFVSSKV